MSSSQNKEKNTPFALFGSEKMFYDIRMGPQAIHDNGIIYIVYQANEKEIYADPYIVTYEPSSGIWSAPVQVGAAERYAFDHHLCPVIWMDNSGYIHILFNCHGNQGSHVISERPRCIDKWRDGPVISNSISYPHIFRLPNGGVVLYFRAFGHMGYWAYSVSHDGGYTWTKPITVVDFDQNPENDEDTWAGSYHSAMLGSDGKTLHIGFTYFDERGIWKFVHHRYKRKPSVNTRYHIYYLKIDLETGFVRNVQGDKLQIPLNRRGADICKIIDTDDYLTMMPTMLEGTDGTPSFLFPITGETEWDCGFYYLYRDMGVWKKERLTTTNTTWSGSRLVKDSKGNILAYMIVGETDGSIYTYGAGLLEKWCSKDCGRTWSREKKMVPEEGLLYNNPIFVEEAIDNSKVLPGYVIFYGWEGPYSIQPTIDKPTDIPIINRGKAYLYYNDELV